MSSAIVAEGRLVRDTITLVGTDGAAWLQVALGLDSSNVIVARQRVGQGYAAQYVSRNKAQHLKRGQRVRVYAASITVELDEVRLHGVERIEELDLPVMEVAT